MSAIYGICCFDSQPARIENLRSMAGSLSHRGPDGGGVWIGATTGLGHCLLHTTPESINESLPLRRGELVITADARIDNREDLLRALLPDRKATAPITDSELILLAYERWGEACPEHLLGDFAFAVWNVSSRELFCARDHLGVKPFYFHHLPGRHFIFASEMKAILGMPNVPRQLDESKLADFMLDRFEDTSRTFYTDVRRLPSATSITVGPSAARFQTYWALDPQREIVLKSDAEYAEAFRGLFYDAVRCRLRSAFPVGTMLSGGLDSSSITCAAYELSRASGDPGLHTFSITFDQVKQSDEREHIAKVLNGRAVSAHYVNGDEVTPFDELETVLGIQDEPFCAPNLALTRRAWCSARDSGVRVLLDGLLGDNVVSHGVEYLNELAGRWKLIALARELRQIIKTSRPDARLIDPLLAYWMREGVKPYVPAVLLALWRRYRGYPTDAAEKQNAIFRPEFSQRAGVKQRLIQAHAAERKIKDARHWHCKSLNCGIVQSALETYNLGCAEFGLETRFPFADKRLVEFCVAIPGSQKIAQGYTRMILRRAMADCLPEQIRWRVGKGDLGWSFNHGFVKKREFVDSTLRASEGFLSRFLEYGRVENMLARLRNRPLAEEELSELFSIVLLSSWNSAVFAERFPVQ